MYENKEIYKINAHKIKTIIDACYCKYVSAKENKELCEEIYGLLGLYSYAKDKVHIKPYIVMGADI